MTISSPAANAAWGFFEWAATGAATLLASVGAFVWRLTLRLQAIEATLTRQRRDLDLARQASEASALHLAERLELLFAEHHRLREFVVVLPNPRRSARVSTNISPSGSTRWRRGSTACSTSKSRTASDGRLQKRAQRRRNAHRPPIAQRRNQDPPRREKFLSPRATVWAKSIAAPRTATTRVSTRRRSSMTAGAK